MTEIADDQDEVPDETSTEESMQDDDRNTIDVVLAAGDGYALRSVELCGGDDAMWEELKQEAPAICAGREEELSLLPRVAPVGG